MGAMGNRHLFELINAGPGLDAWHRVVGLFLAQWAVVAVGLGFAWLWTRTDRAGRLELLRALVSMLLALLLAEAIRRIWPQPRPFTLHLGAQYFGHAADGSLPSAHTTALWALGLAALRSRRYGPLAFPLLALGLLVGWSRVYLGVHFPYDIAAALPVAALGVLLETLAAGALAPLALRAVRLYERLEHRILDTVAGRHRGNGG